MTPHPTRDDSETLIEISRWQREQAEELGITLPSIMDRVTPLEILSLAETRRTDPDLALKIAEQSARQVAR